MPRNWRLFPIDPGKVRFMAFSLLFDRQNGALLLDTLRAAAEGDFMSQSATKRYNLPRHAALHRGLVALLQESHEDPS